MRYTILILLFPVLLTAQQPLMFIGQTPEGKHIFFSGLPRILNDAMFQRGDPDTLVAIEWAAFDNGILEFVSVTSENLVRMLVNGEVAIDSAVVVQITSGGYKKFKLNKQGKKNFQQRELIKGKWVGKVNYRDEFKNYQKHLGKKKDKLKIDVKKK